MMKKSFSLICLLLLAFSVFGQDEETVTLNKIRFGVKVGTTLSSFSEQQPHTNYKPGFIAGGFLSYELSNSLALQLEPSYIEQGGNLISIFDYPMFLIPDPPFILKIRDQRVTFHNIDIPLLLKYETTILGLKVFGVAGPSIALNINSETKNDVSARSLDNVPIYYNFYEEENITSNIEFLQYGITGGIGFETPLGNHSLIFDMKYRYSLNRTYPGYSYLGIYQVQGDLRTNSFYVTLGFGF
jgi:hypothetical protein